jgi:hypothetical protein
VAKRARATTTRLLESTTRVAGEQSNKGNGNKGGGQTTVTRAAVMAMATMWAIAMVTRLMGKERETARVARANLMARRVVGIEEGKGGKAMAIAAWVAGKEMATTMMRAMVMNTKEAGEEEGNGKGGKRDGNGEEDGNGKQ